MFPLTLLSLVFHGGTRDLALRRNSAVRRRLFHNSVTLRSRPLLGIVISLRSPVTDLMHLDTVNHGLTEIVKEKGSSKAQRKYKNDYPKQYIKKHVAKI